MSRPTRILLFAGNIWNFAEGMFGPLLAVFSQRVGGDILEITGAWATYLLVSGVLQMFIGRISDRFDKRRIMVAGYALNTIMTFAYLLVSSAESLFLLQIGLGVANALANPTWYALYDKHSGKGNKDGLLWGVEEGLPDVMTGIGILLGGFIVFNFSFDALFILMGTFQLLATLVQVRIFRYL